MKHTSTDQSQLGSENCPEPSELGHTPGPWKWARRYDGDSGRPMAILLETEHRPVRHNDPVIFAVREDWIDAFVDSPNARLISAAPELLAELEYFLGRVQVGDIEDRPENERTRVHVRQATEAIRKAKWG